MHYIYTRTQLIYNLSFIVLLLHKTYFIICILFVAVYTYYTFRVSYYKHAYWLSANSFDDWLCVYIITAPVSVHKLEYWCCKERHIKIIVCSGGHGIQYSGPPLSLLGPSHRPEPIPRPALASSADLTLWNTNPNQLCLNNDMHGSLFFEDCYDMRVMHAKAFCSLLPRGYKG